MPSMPIENSSQGCLPTSRAILFNRFTFNESDRLLINNNLVPDDNGTRYQLHLTDRAEWQHTLREKDLIDVFYAKTSSGQR